MIITNRQYWTTSNELAYLDGLADGSWRQWCESPPEISSEELLGNYIRGAEHRKRHKTFGAVDPKVVIKVARLHLARVRGDVGNGERA